jgi:hypothetical protein
MLNMRDRLASSPKSQDKDLRRHRRGWLFDTPIRRRRSGGTCKEWGRRCGRWRWPTPPPSSTRRRRLGAFIGGDAGSRARLAVTLHNTNDYRRGVHHA